MERSRVSAWMERLTPTADRFDADKRLGRRLLADEATVYVRGVQA
ncbi:MAG: hypothetical protein QW587_09095 [Candidatus Bathyarchaeia archaeon]